MLIPLFNFPNCNDWEGYLSLSSVDCKVKARWLATGFVFFKLPFLKGRFGGIISKILSLAPYMAQGRRLG
jgi:hypothetical protein